MNHRLVNLKLSSQPSSAFSFSKSLADTTNTVRIKFPALSALLSTVLHVVRGGPQKQMIGTDAVTNVAFVTYVQVVGNWTEVNYPRGSVGLFVFFLTNSKDTVTIVAYSARPEPAGLGLINFGPESSFRSLSFSDSKTRAITELSALVRRVKARFARFTCYCVTSQDVNLRDRFANWSGPLATNNSAWAV